GTGATTACWPAPPFPSAFPALPSSPPPSPPHDDALVRGVCRAPARAHRAGAGRGATPDGPASVVSVAAGTAATRLCPAQPRGGGPPARSRRQMVSAAPAATLAGRRRRRRRAVRCRLSSGNRPSAAACCLPTAVSLLELS